MQTLAEKSKSLIYKIDLYLNLATPTKSTNGKEHIVNVQQNTDLVSHKTMI